MFRKKDLIDTDTGVLSTDVYNSELEYIIRLYNCEKPIYFNPCVVLIITIVLIASDAVTLFSSFQKVLLKDDEPVLISVVIISAAALEILPILVSIIMRKMEIEKKRNQGVNFIYIALCTTCLLAFVFVFAFSSNVRWQTQDLMVSLKESTTTTTSEINLNVGTTISRKHIRSVTLMLMALPFLTSCISFVLSYFSFDPVRERELQKAKHRVELMAYKPRLSTARKILEETTYTGNELDDLQKAINANTDAYAETAKSMANEALAKRLGTAEALDECCKSSSDKSK